MIQHFVCFQFKENTPAAAVEQHLAMFAALKEAIPQIVTYTGGQTYPGGESVDRFDTAHYVTYATRADLEIYIHHPAHQHFIEANRSHWKDVLVVDSEF